MNKFLLLDIGYVAFPHLCLQFTPGWLVDAGMPHLLIAVKLLACPEDALKAVLGSVS